MGVRAISMGLCVAFMGCASTRECAPTLEANQPQVAMRAERAETPRALPMLDHESLADDISAALRTAQTTQNVLVLSGGGANGVFGAGFLQGWRDRQTGDVMHPDSFRIVTGVSTGSLMAPFAFLGEYDQLAKIYMSVDSRDIQRLRFLLSIPFSNSIASSAPLRDLIRETITPRHIEAVAREYTERDRRLYVGAVNLDLGTTRAIALHEIAASGAPDAEERFERALFMSTAVPLQFPPVFEDGHMYVDGAVRDNALYVTCIEACIRAARASDAHAKLAFYTLVNGHIEPAARCVKNGLVPIGLRSLDVLLQQNTQGNLYRGYILAEAFGNLPFRWAAVPPEVPLPEGLTFTKEEMRELVDAGRRAGANPASWKTDPPGISPLEAEALGMLLSER